MKTIATLVFALLFCAGCAKEATDAAAKGSAVTVGAKAPEINAEKWMNAEGTSVTLAGLTGKVVVVEFWATWCPPCRQSIPHLVELSTKLKERGVVFIGLTSEDYTTAKIEKFMKDMKMGYIVGTGSSSDKDYGVIGIPTAFVLDKKGKVVWTGHPMSGLEAALEKVARGGESASPDVPAMPPVKSPAKKVNTGT